MSEFYFVEGKIYSEHVISKSHVYNGYFRKIPNEEKYKLEVTGIIFGSNNTYCFLPKNTEISLNSKKNRKTMKLVIFSIMKYKSTIRMDKDEQDWIGNVNVGVGLFDTINWLLTDYKNNRLYSENVEKIEINGKGRILWNKTIKNKVPYILGNQIFYNDLNTKKNNMNLDSQIAKIHKNIIYECTLKYGWLFGMETIGKHNERNLSIDNQIRILRNKLNETFNSRNIMLFKNMIIYLSQSNKSKENLSLVTPYFHNIWEVSLRSVVSNDLSFQDDLPNPYWLINDRKIKTRQIPDVLLNDNSKSYILDAKYYSIDRKDYKGLPGWDSIVKQLYYQLSLKDHYKIEGNYFIIPYKVHTDELSSYLGYASVDNKENVFGVIHTFLIDIDFVLDNYIKEKSVKKYLIEMIRV